jgi:hypothetical protein
LLTAAGVKCGYIQSFAAVAVIARLKQGPDSVNELFIGFLLISTAILAVILGILGAYGAISAVLAAVNPAHPMTLARLVPHQNHASGD